MFNGPSNSWIEIENSLQLDAAYLDDLTNTFDIGQLIDSEMKRMNNVGRIARVFILLQVKF